MGIFTSKQNPLQTIDSYVQCISKVQNAKDNNKSYGDSFYQKQANKVIQNYLAIRKFNNIRFMSRIRGLQLENEKLDQIMKEVTRFNQMTQNLFNNYWQTYSKKQNVSSQYKQ